MTFRTIRVGVSGKVPGLVVGAAFLSGVSGCADLRLSDSEVTRIANELGGLLPLECQGSGGTKRNKTIDIVFVNKGTADDPIWCPQKSLEGCPQTYNGKMVSWRSVKEDGNGATETIRANFTVYFSPFPSGSIGSGGNSVAGPRPLNQNAPAGVYKYTVAPENITEDCKALDPNFWVNT